MTSNNIDPLFKAIGDRIYRVSVKGLFPGLIIGSLGNQQLDSEWMLLVGQLAFWFNIFAASIIVIFRLRYKSYAFIMILGLFVSRVGRILMGESSPFFMLYTICLCTLFGIAGAFVLFYHRRILYRQVIFFCWISIPMMVLQLSGAGQWTQTFRTDYHGYGKQQYPTVLMDKDNVVVSTVQTRPAGFCHANNFLSLIIIYALFLQYGTGSSPNLTTGDLAVCGVIVLSMAKICFLAFFVFAVWFFFFGTLRQKKKMLKVLGLLGVLVLTYALIYPGIFAYTTSWEVLRLNFVLRVLDLNLAMGGNVLLEEILNHIDGSRDYLYRVVGGRESGYAYIGRNLAGLIVVISICSPLYILALRKMISSHSEFREILFLGVLMLFLLPLITSFITGPVFWFITGFAFMPLIYSMGLIAQPRCVPADRISPSAP